MQEFDFRKNTRKLRSGEATEAALSCLAAGARAVGGVVETMMTLRYGTSIYGATRHAERYVQERELREAEQRERARCYRLLSRLKKDGLVDGDGRSGFKITAAGREKLGELKEKVLRLPTPKTYSTEKTDEYIVVTFDIPERKRKARDWLRGVLEHLEFQMVHQSVWIGKSKLPKQLLSDLQRHQIIDHIEVLGVQYSGSIQLVDEKR